MNHSKNKDIRKIFSYFLLIVMLSSILMPSPRVQATEGQDAAEAQSLDLGNQDELKAVEGIDSDLLPAFTTEYLNYPVEGEAIPQEILINFFPANVEDSKQVAANWEVQMEDGSWLTIDQTSEETRFESGKTYRVHLQLQELASQITGLARLKLDQLVLTLDPIANQANPDEEILADYYSPLLAVDVPVNQAQAETPEDKLDSKEEVQQDANSYPASNMMMQSVSLMNSNIENANYPYKLSFELLRRDNNYDYEDPRDAYFNYWRSCPENSEYNIYNEEEDHLNAFSIEHLLHLDYLGETEQLKGQMTITPDELYPGLYYYEWDGVAPFTDIPVPHDELEVRYYREDNGALVKPYLLQYHLYLKEENNKMVLWVPLLRPIAVAEPTGEEIILEITNLKVTGRELYLNGQSGADSNDGKTIDTAVKTFGKAQELATQNKNIKYIYVTGTTDIAGMISLAGTNAQIYRAEGFNRYLFKLPAGQEATLADIVIDGNSPINAGIEESLIYAGAGATINIGQGVELRNNVIKNTGVASYGGAIHAQSASVNMYGGNIVGNQANLGGGIYLESSIMNFSGGIIQNNKAVRLHEYDTDFGSGGGILAYEASEIFFSDQACLSGNYAEEIGGGLSLGYQSPDATKGSQLHMTGGTISDNTSESSGGGIFVQLGINHKQPSIAHIQAGKIINNKMTDNGNGNSLFGGGGIYVNGMNGSDEFYGASNGELYLTNALITNNTAGHSGRFAGAGYAACPTTDTKIYVTNGCAIYDNAAARGKDIYIKGGFVNKYHSGNPPYELSKRMLGGVAYAWKNDDGSLLKESRYEGRLGNDESLRLHTDSKGNALTKKLTKVIISGNVSLAHGGGIGSNGTVIFGEEGTTQVSVTKKWDDNNNGKSMRPDSITVNLLVKVDGQNYVMDSAVLSEANNWSFTFKDLPTKNGQEYFEYSVEEVAVSGYTGEISGDLQNGFVITNSIPTEPTKPTETEPAPPPPPSVIVSSPIVFKKIDGGQPDQADLFSFRIEPVSYRPDQMDPRPEPKPFPLPQNGQGVVREVQISGEGTISTGQISYTQPGYYEYKIQELDARDGKYTYSTDVYTFVDHVYLQDGQLMVDRRVYKNGLDSNTTTAYFTNLYQGKPPISKGQVTSLPATGASDNLGWSLSLTLMGVACLALIRKHYLR